MEGQIGCALAQCRRDAADMEPVGPLEDGLPVERAGAGLCHARVGAVVDDDRGALVGPGFQEVDAQAFPAAQMRDVSMPCRRSSARAASPTGLPGSTVTSAASSPKS